MGLVIAKFNLAGFITFSNRTKPSFIFSGFKDWNDTGRRFRSYQASDIHQEAVMRLTAQPVDELLNKALKEQKRLNRDMLKQVVSAIIYLSRQSIPLRGWFGCYYATVLHNILLFDNVMKLICSNFSGCMQLLSPICMQLFSSI